MGLFIGFLIFIGSYFMIGPMIMTFYTTYNAKHKTIANKVIWLGVFLAIVYVVIWILLACFATQHIGWCVVGAIIGLICAIVTFNKNKEQTLNDFNSNGVATKNNYDKCTLRNIDQEDEDFEDDMLNVQEDLSHVQELQQKIASIYAGSTEEFSVSELVGCAINLQSFKQKLPTQVYKLVEKKFREYEKVQSKKKYNLMQFVSEMMRIQDEFSEIIEMPIYPDGTI